MKHLEPQEQVQRLAPAPTKQPWSRMKIFFTVAAAIAVLGFGMGKLFGQQTSDHLSESERQQLQNNFARMHPLKPPRVPAADIPKVLDTMQLEPAAKRNLERVVTESAKSSNTPTELVLVKLWDFASEDGDVVEISSGGYQMQVALKNAPVEIAVPVDKDHAITLTGMNDGGGGITVAVMAGDQECRIPPMAPGQTITLPTN